MSNGASAVRRHFYLKDLITGSEIRAHGMPESYTDSKSANWVSTGILLRSSPLMGYKDSEPRTVSFSFNFHAGVEQSDSTTPADVKRCVDFLLSLAYPDYSGGIKPPHLCFLSLGGQVRMKCVLRSVTATYSAPYDVNTGLAHHAKVSIVAIEVDDIPKSYEQVRGGG